MTTMTLAPNGVGFVEVGMCPRCSTPGHLFTHTLMKEAGWANGSYVALCYDCLPPSISEKLNGHDYSAWRIMLTDIKSALYDYRTIVVDESEPRCHVCLRPEFDNYKFRLVEAWYQEEVPVMAHTVCASNLCDHEECEGRPYVSRWNNASEFYDRIGTSQQFPVNIYRLDDNGDRFEYCENHFEQLVDLRGGRSEWYECARCSWIHFFTNGGVRLYDDYYCDDCADDVIVSCDYCDNRYHIDEGHDCDNEDSYSGPIYPYDYRPAPCFFGRDSDPERYHLGFELEIESKKDIHPSSCAETLQGILNERAYYKSDGSLSFGVEIVTHPHTLEEYRTRFPWNFTEQAKQLGFRSWDTSTCGFHVHVSRYAFGTGIELGESHNAYLNRTIIVRQRHELRFIKLIYDNQRQIERLSGRSNSRWATFNDKGRLWSKVRDRQQVDGHYSAVNTENRETIEVRVFRGTLNSNRLMAYLEFVASAVEYTRNLRVTPANKALSWMKFTAYVATNMEKYPYLFELMNRNLIEDKPYDNRTDDEGDDD